MGTYIFCHLFETNGDVSLCKNSFFSFKSINKNFDYKSLSCFIARNLVWQDCSFAPVQKNQNPSGGFDSPGPLAVNVSQIKDLGRFRTGVVYRIKNSDSTANDLAGAISRTNTY